MKLYINHDFDCWEFEPYPEIFIKYKKPGTSYDKNESLSVETRKAETSLKRCSKYLQALEDLFLYDNVIFLHPSAKGKLDTCKKLSCAPTYTRELGYFKKLLTTFPESMFIVSAILYEDQSNYPVFDRIRFDYIRVSLTNPVFNSAHRKHSVTTLLNDLA